MAALTEYIDQVWSDHLGNDRTVWVSPPLDPDATSLVVFLDGELYRHRVGAPAVFRELRERHAISDAWTVFVSCKDGESRWRECPCHRPFAAFVAGELLARLTRYFPEIGRVRRRVLVGLSYTGLAAAYVARAMPGIFQTVICQSGSLWWNECWLVDEYRRNPLRTPTRFYLDVGLRETQTNLRHKEDVLQVVSQIDGIHRFRDVLSAQGVEVKLVEFNGGHHFLEWRATLPGALEWALPPDVVIAPQLIEPAD